MYFKLVELKNDIKQGKAAVTLLDGPAYNWYSIQGNVNHYSDLIVVMLDYFKLADYAYKMC